jgi:hypothetical protein
MPEGHVYILGSTTGTLYIGVTSKFDQRLFEHKTALNPTSPASTDVIGPFCTSATSTYVPQSHERKK